MTAIHRDSPWFFSNNGDGRFDLLPDGGIEGTCYIASDTISAVLEVLDGEFEPGDVLGKPFFEQRKIWKIEPNDPWSGSPIANLKNNWWRGYGLTQELWTVAKNDLPPPLALLPREWSTALRVVRFDGARVGLRHSANEESFGIALFGPQGPAPEDDRFDAEDTGQLAHEDMIAFSNATQIAVEGVPIDLADFNVIT